MEENAGGRILFVDDDTSLRTVVPIALTRDGYQVDTAASGEEALAKFSPGAYDLIIQDVRMPGMNGLELLERLRQLDTQVPVVVMTAFSNWDVAMDAMRLGAFDYIKKPFDNDDLRDLARRAVAYGSVTDGDEDWAKVRMIGTSQAMREIQDLLRRVGRTDSTVLVEGESGTGKELIAAMLHARSHRREGPFVAVNCGGFSETLLESELFGHVKGAFTGAVADKRGLLELANGGTFFLDELGETTLSTQVRLLRVLETRSFLPVGGETPRHTDVRFVAATNRNLAEMVDAGMFRQDLYYRLNVIPVRIAPLRERREDVPLLAGYYLSLYAERFGKHLIGFEIGAMDAMLEYDWPGNVRELQNAVQRAVSLAEHELIAFNDVFPSWGGGRGNVPSAAPKPRSSSTDIVPASAPPGKGQEGDCLPAIGEGFNLEDTMEKVEAKYIREALAMTNNNLTQAAELLGITFRSIRYKVKKMKD